MNIKKVLGLVGVVICVSLLILVGIRIISWSLFWMILIAVAGFAYFVLPRMSD